PYKLFVFITYILRSLLLFSTPTDKTVTVSIMLWLREGHKHSIYTNGIKIIPIKRHRIFDRITANELCKQAGLKPQY
ncbi:MAG: hypothetical protein JW901_02130, partial [Dehalococcoidia bacterium]|nr:hypothetical protein [Dehalococcoidia bacterium]